MNMKTALTSFFGALAVSGCMVMPQTLERYPVDPVLAPPPPTPMTAPAGNFTPDNRPEALSAPPLQQRQLPVELTSAQGQPYPPARAAQPYPTKTIRSKGSELRYQPINALR